MNGLAALRAESQVDGHTQSVLRLVGAIDMPDRRASLLARFLPQGGGRLSKGKREAFGEPVDEALAATEEAVGAAIGAWVG